MSLAVNSVYPPPNREQLQTERLQLLFVNLPITSVTAIIVAAIAVIPFWQQGERVNIAIWLSLTIVIALGRWLLWREWRSISNVSARSNAFWYRCFLASSISGGIGWGMASVLLFPAADLSGQMILVFVIAGICSGAAVTLSADRRAAWVFIFPCMVPLLVQLYLHSVGIGWEVALTGLLYLTIITQLITRSSKQIEENLLLRLAAVEREHVREQSELALRASQEKINALFELSPIGIMLTTIDGEVVEINSSLRRILGYSLTELKAVGGLGLMPQKYRAEHKTRWQSLRQIGHTDSFELELIHRSGSLIPVSSHRIAIAGLDGKHYVWSMVEDISARKAADARAAMARAQLEAFIEFAPAAVAMLDREMRYIAYSRRWLIDCGIGDKPIIGHSHYELFPMLEARWRIIHQRCLRGAVEQSEGELFISPGGNHWYRWEIRPWREASGEIGGIVIYTEDITESKKTLDALRARDELLKKISERVPGFIYQYQLGENGMEKFAYASDAVRDIYELTPEDLYVDASALVRTIYPEDTERLKASIAMSQADLSSWSLDYRVQLPKKGLRWLHGDAVAERLEDGTVMWHGYVSDITERKHAEEQLQALNKRLALATLASGMGVWEMDLKTGELVWDERMYELYQMPMDPPVTRYELAGTRVHPDDFESLAKVYNDAVSDPTCDRYLAEHRLSRPDGSEPVIKSAAILLRDKAGVVQRIIGVAWDITESKMIERMKSEFVSTVSHELRTPLTSIRGSLGLVAGGIAGVVPEKALELINVAYKNSERLSLLINDILDIEKIESGKARFQLQKQPLLSIIEQAIEANRGYAQTCSVEFVLQAGAADAEVAVDADRLMQVMANLLSNAAKFSPPFSRVEIAVIAAANSMRVEVRDSGSGIPVEFRERIFQKFSQADASDTRVKGGTGLGLAITKTIVEKMHGQIGFTARAGGGTIFFFELPRVMVSDKVIEVSA